MISELQQLIRKINTALDGQTALFKEHKFALTLLEGLNKKIEENNNLTKQLIEEVRGLRADLRSKDNDKNQSAPGIH